MGIAFFSNAFNLFEHFDAVRLDSLVYVRGGGAQLLKELFAAFHHVVHRRPRLPRVVEVLFELGLGEGGEVCTFLAVVRICFVSQ